LALLLLAVPMSPTAADDAVRQGLAPLKDRVVTALNADDIETLLTEVTPEVAFTAMNGRVAHGRDGVRAYFDTMRGSIGSSVTEYHIALTPDGPVRLYGGDNAVATGDAQAHYKFKGGMVLDAHGRWTADLVRQNDRWQIAAVHYSGNLFDNPLLDAARTAAWLAGGIAVAVGFIIGGRWWRPARSAST